MSNTLAIHTHTQATTPTTVQLARKALAYKPTSTQHTQHTHTHTHTHTHKHTNTHTHTHTRATRPEVGVQA
jgi:hypothetical protein